MQLVTQNLVNTRLRLDGLWQGVLQQGGSTLLARAAVARAIRAMAIGDARLAPIIGRLDLIAPP